MQTLLSESKDIQTILTREYEHRHFNMIFTAEIKTVMKFSISLQLQANKVVPTEKAKSYAESLGIPFLETSAKTATNIETAFLQVTTALIRSR